MSHVPVSLDCHTAFMPPKQDSQTQLTVCDYPALASYLSWKAYLGSSIDGAAHITRVELAARTFKMSFSCHETDSNSSKICVLPLAIVIGRPLTYLY